MNRIRFGRTELTVSEVAFGGIPIMRVSESEAISIIREIITMGVNFLDTAHGYGDSEEKIGKAITSFPRESLVLASKSPARDKKTFLEHLHLSLKRLQTDYIDIYQLHSVSTEDAMEQVLSADGAFEGLTQAIKEGKVRFPAFSAHNLEIGEKMISTGLFDVTQIPFNFIDKKAADSILPLALQHDMGFIAMKPLGGGMLEDARLCFKYLKQFEGVVPDPGIEKAHEMREIIEIIEDPSPLSDKDFREMERISEELGETWCHRCDYCQPCPEEIPISMMLNLRSFVKRLPFERMQTVFGEKIEKARNCRECEDCVERCPYDLDIPELIKKNLTRWDRYVRTRVWEEVT